MKKIIVYACSLLLSIGAMSCGDAETKDDTSNNGDTAVLVEDPNNNLEANPVNDTTVHDTAGMNQASQ